MTLVFIFLSPLLSLLALLFLYLRFLAVPGVWRWLKAAPPGNDPIWRQVSDCAREVARRHRVPEPILRVLPEFAPNALVLRCRGRTELGLTEGLVRALGSAELEATISLCLFQGTQARRRLQTGSGLLLFPFAKRLSYAPFAFRLLLTPVLSMGVRLGGNDQAWFASDAAAAAMHGPWQVAATLQKLGVMGRKIPVKRWNLALDSLFVVAPLALDEGPHSLLQGMLGGQPSVTERRERLLAGAEQ